MRSVWLLYTILSSDLHSTTGSVCYGRTPLCQLVLSIICDLDALQVSEAKKKKAAAKKAKAPGGAAAKDAASQNENTSPANGVQEVKKGVEEVDMSNDRSCTSILTSHPQSRDIHLESFSLLFHGHELLVDTSLELNFGRQAAALYCSRHAYAYQCCSHFNI